MPKMMCDDISPGDRGLSWRRRPCEVWIPYGFDDGQDDIDFDFVSSLEDFV